MKILWLLRHAKSSWRNKILDDFHRPLSKRGIDDSPFMAKHLLELDFSVDTIVSSPSLRTQETLRLMAPSFGLRFEDLVFNEKIYEAPLPQLLSVIRGFKENWNKVAIMGHNPGLTLLSNYLVEAIVESIPTAGGVCIHLDIPTWKKIREKRGKLIHFIFPKAVRTELNSSENREDEK